MERKNILNVKWEKGQMFWKNSEDVALHPPFNEQDFNVERKLTKEQINLLQSFY